MSANRRTYLDANAAERLRPEARAALLAALDPAGNPASLHQEGRAARRILEHARHALAACYAAPADGIVFCSGGTEANALAVTGLGHARRLLIGATEHDAVRTAATHAQTLPVDHAGVVDLAALETALAQPGPALVCLMLANNETGVLHPIDQAAEICRAHGALLHVDACQAAGRITLRLDRLGAHSLAISSHKLGGPAGAGALLLDAEAAAALVPTLRGGGQERGRRGGSQPVAAIAGFAAAAALPCTNLAALRDRAEHAALGCGAIVAGANAPRLPNTTCLALPGVAAQTQLIALDLAGIAVSAGSACSSGKLARSHVLEAMGFGPLAGQAIRVSLPWNTTDADIDAFATAYTAMAGRVARAA